MPSRIRHIIIHYIKLRASYIVILLYFLVNALLNIFFEINIGIPCPWRTLFLHKCPGCGLTSASIQCVKGDLQGAWEYNPLIFIIIPALIIIIIRDFWKTKKLV